MHYQWTFKYLRCLRPGTPAVAPADGRGARREGVSARCRRSVRKLERAPGGPALSLACAARPFLLVRGLVVASSRATSCVPPPGVRRRSATNKSASPATATAARTLPRRSSPVGSRSSRWFGGGGTRPGGRASGGGESVVTVVNRPRQRHKSRGPAGPSAF